MSPNSTLHISCESAITFSFASFRAAMGPGKMFSSSSSLRSRASLISPVRASISATTSSDIRVIAILIISVEACSAFSKSSVSVSFLIFSISVFSRVWASPSSCSDSDDILSIMTPSRCLRFCDCSARLCAISFR